MEARSLIAKDDDILGGTVVFAGTRVPVDALFDYVEADHTLGEFLTDFPTVGREQVEGVLELSKERLQGAALEAAA